MPRRSRQLARRRRAGRGPVFATSALTGQGIPELRTYLADAAASKHAARARLEADLDVVAAEVSDALGDGSTSLPEIDTLVTDLENAAGVPVVIDAVGATVRHRGTLVTGWPLVNWIARLRPDPLRRLRLAAPHGAASDRTGEVTLRTSLPSRSHVADARVSSGLRAFSRAASTGMPQDWREAVDAAVHRAEEELPDALDAAVAGADLGVDRTPIWWSLVRVIQWLLIITVAAGVVWLLVQPTWEAMACIVGGVLGGMLVSLSCRAINGAVARRARRRAYERLHASVHELVERAVLGPVSAELQHYAGAQEALQRVVR